MNKYTIDFTDCKYLHQIHEAANIGMEFREGCGKSWDAFWDFITDYGKEEFCIEILGLETLDKSLNEEINMMIYFIKKYREEYNPHLVIKIVYNDDVFI